MQLLTKIKNKYISLRFGLGSAFVGIVILTSLLLGFTMYVNVRSFIREGIRDRLGEAIGIAALQVQADRHKTLVNTTDEDSAAYREIRKSLQDIRGRTKDIRFVYSIRKNKDGKVTFVVDAEEKPENMSHLGDIYEKPTEEMLASFQKPYQVHVEDQFFTDKWGTFLSSYAPIIANDGSLEAVLGMDISAVKVIEYERHFLLVILIVCSFVSVAVVTVGVLFSRRISRPLMILEEEMSRIQNFDLGSEIPIKSRINEVNNMKIALDDMKSGLRSFKKYVPAELVSQLIHLHKEAVLGAEKRELSIFFSDIANFTATSELLSPEDLAESLGIYFKGMTRAILQNKGTVDKFIGDAIMSFWGAPTEVQNSALLACRSALQCQTFLAHIGVEWASKGLPLFETRIGINTGEAIVGNMGYEERLSYTAIGDAVNLASRLEGLNKYYGTKIIISEFTYARVNDDMAARLIDTVAVKGKQKGVKIYELIADRDSLGHDESDLIDLFNSGMQLYLEHDWIKAMSAFSRTLEIRPLDRPSQILMERCRKFSENPPPENWTGVIVMREK